MTHTQPLKEKYQYKLSECKDLWLCIFCVITGSLCLFAFDNFTELYSDELFQAICVRRYKESPLGLFSFWIGHLWTSAFGFTILNLRILTSFELLLSMTITSAYCYRITRNLKLTSVVFLLGSILLRAGTFAIYNWDTGTYIFDAAAICLLVSLIRSARWWKALALGFFIGLMTLGRTTSAIMLPLALILILCFNFKEKKYKTTLISESLIIAGWICAIIVFSTIILGSPRAYLDSFISDNLISGHSDIHVLWGHFAMIMLMLPYFWCFGIGCLLLSLIVPKLKKTNAVWLLLVWLVFCILLQSNLDDTYLKPDINHGVGTPLGLGLLLVIPIFRLFHKNFSADKTTVYCIWAYAILIFSIAFGSDVYIRRMTVGFTFPLIIASLWDLHNVKIRAYLRTLVKISLLTFGLVFLSHSIYIICSRNEMTSFDHPIFKDLYIKSNFIQEMKDSYQAISAVRRDSTAYAYLGEHLGSELLSGPDKGLSFQNYHRALYQKHVWDQEKDKIIPRVDAFIYPLENKYWDLSVIIDEIKDAGFTDSLLVGKAMILYRKSSNDKTKVTFNKNLN